MKLFAGVIIGLCCCTLISARDDGCTFTHPVDPCAEEDGKLNMTGLATKYGYPMETHEVETKDGYILSLYRIPYGRKCGPSEKPKVPVLLQHGLLSSSYDYLILGPRKALGYLLADECYDVWLGNNRGNGESKRHVFWKPSQKQFWTFSWHEMGQYDLPAMIDHILNVTGQDSLHYVGHSQGTTQFFVFGSLHPDYHQKIRSMHALSPVAFMKHLSSPLVKVMTIFKDALEKLFDIIGVHELFPSKTFLNLIGSEICHNKFPHLQSICCNVMFLLCGFDEPQLNKTILPAIVGHTPAGAAVKQVLHYAQGIQSEEFRQFDYGQKKNLQFYGTKVPPSYEVEKINIPVVFYYGANDFMAAIKDVKKLESKLPNIVEKHLVPYTKFSHLDFLFAIDIRPLVYDKLINIIKKY